jgi:hypothetical protein
MANYLNTGNSVLFKGSKPLIHSQSEVSHVGGLLSCTVFEVIYSPLTSVILQREALNKQVSTDDVSHTNESRLRISATKVKFAC